MSCSQRHLTPTAAPNPAMTLRFHVERRWRRVGEPSRSACLMRGLLLALLLGLSGCGNDRISADSERKLQPVIQFVDSFVKKNGRLPTDSEFHQAADHMAWMVVLRDKHNPYAASKGATNDLDYMAGIWRADWYHYYKSWDKKFLNASDEQLK